MGGSLNLVSDDALKYALYEETPFPIQPEFQWIKQTFERQYNLMHGLSLKLLECLALGLGKERDFFRDWFAEDSLST